MAAIDTCNKPSEWAQLRAQIRLQLETDYPFVSAFVNRMTKREHPLGLGDLDALSDELGVDRGRFAGFLRDLWLILAAKIRGNGTSIVNHALDTLTEGGEDVLRATAVWYEMERESRGQTTEI